MKIYQKLIKTQNELKAPKGQYNKFGKYNYRSCEDILEAVKPILLKNGLTLFIRDEIEQIGERYYIKAICTLVDIETGSTIEASAMARESLDKKGMDSSQVTGATSSYARKYALNGLFLIDDTKDFDTDELHQNNSTSSKANANTMKPATISSEKCKQLYSIAGTLGFTPDDVKKSIAYHYNKTSASDLTISEFKDIVSKLEQTKNK